MHHAGVRYLSDPIHHRGEPFTIRWFISVMIQHYCYHAGEINHIRALSQRNDA